jgi:Fe-Mn family superoxide dismutase
VKQKENPVNEACQVRDMADDHGALEPRVTGKILTLHHSRHHAGYVKGANQALEPLAASRSAVDFATLTTLQKDMNHFNAKGDYVEPIRPVVNWTDVAERLTAARLGA